MVINSKIAYVKKKEVFEPLINTIPSGLNPIVFIEDTREMWTCGTYFSIGYPSIEISETSGSVKVQIGNSFFLMSTTGDSISIRKGDGNRIIISSNALSKVDTEPPLEWDTSSRKLLHMKSGVAPGSYGQSTSLGNASVFIVPNIVVDSTGHITYAQNYNVEIRDYVEQLAPSTLMGNRNVLLSYNEANENMDTSQVRKANGLYFNDATQKLTVTGGIDSDGPINVNHGDLSVLDGYIIGNLKGDVEGEAKPKIHLSDKPEYGGASINLYGHVKLQDVLNNQPEPSSDNDNINNVNVVNAIAASPLMVWNAIQTAKDYADSILGSNNAMLYKGAIEAGTKSPGAYTPAAQIGNTYVVTFGTSSYTDNIGYINGEPVEIGDLLICREETPAATSATWEEIKSKWVYVQTNTTGVVSGPSSSLVGQLAIFNSTSGKLIKGLPNGNVGQMLVIGNSGIPEWVNKPDRLNYALSFQVRGTEFVSFDGYAEKKVNFIAGDNMFITSDAQGNLTLAADPGSDTVNTAGATNNINTKLFLIGAESQTTSPQTYSNQYVYIGPDNKLYSNGKEVSTTDHNHDDRYVNTTGDTMTGALTINHSGINPIYLNSSSTEHCAISIKSNTSTKANFGWFHAWGAYMSDASLNKYINIKSDSLYWNNQYSFLHTGNYTSTLDTRYVKKSGDTMTGSLTIPVGTAGLCFDTGYAGGRMVATDATTMYIQGGNSGKLYITARNVETLSDFDIKSNKATINSNTIWHAGNDGSGSGLDADLLDGVQYQNILERKYSKSTNLNSIGWYRIAKTLSANNGSISFILLLARDYNYGNNESYSFDITINHNSNSASIVQTSGYANMRFIKKIRVTGDNNDYQYVDIYYDHTNSNDIKWTTIGCAKSIDAESNAAALTYTTEFETTNGCKSSLGFVGALTGNADTATKLQTPRTIWGQRFDGTGNINGKLTTNGAIHADGTGSVFLRYSNATVGPYLTADGNGNLHIRGHSNFLYAKEFVTINYATGYFGFGTTNPSHKCHVEGTLYASGAATLGSTLSVSSYIYCEKDWFQNNKSGTGLYNLAHDARWYANANGWYSDKAAAFAGTVTSNGFKKSNSSDSYILLGGGGHKALSEIFKYLGQNVSNDWDTITTMGTMRVTNQTIVNGPYNAYTYGQLLTFNAGGTLSQIYLPHSASGSMYIRTGWSGVSQYYDWIQVLTTANYSPIMDSRYVKKSGDTMTGALTINASQNNILTLNSSGTDSYPYFELRHSGTRQGVYGASNNQPYFYNNGWQKIWHAGNDGSGSGLDADLLDGNQGSRYLQCLGGPNYITITVGGASNTYYPVIIRYVSSYYPLQFVNISRAYNETAPNDWNTSTHKGGLTMTLLWNGSSYWDGNGSGEVNTYLNCVFLKETYSKMVGGLDTSVSGAVIWLRGGTATYHIHAMNGTSVSATVHTSTFTDSANRSFSPKTSRSTVTVQWPGKAESVSKLGTSTVGSTSLPIYLSSGTPTACIPSSVFSNLSNSGNNLSITVAGQNRTLTVAYATSSGNADTLDGRHASYFPINTTVGSVDFNTITTSGIYRLSHTTSNGASNGPGYDWGQMLVLHGGGDTIAQLAFSYSDGGRMKVRAGNPSNVGGGGSWSSWKTIAFTTDKVSSASSADKLGTSTVGSGTKPIYLSSGTPTASSSSVGSTYVPVYLSSGTITSCGYSFKGSSNQPIVVAAGSIYKSGSSWYFSGMKHSSAGAVSITMSGARMQVSVPNTTICAANVNQSSTTTISGTSTSDLYGAGPSAYWFSAYCLNSSYIYIRNMYQRDKENHSWSSDTGGWNNISRISVIMVGYVS